jgi:hypothetical protein
LIIKALDTLKVPLKLNNIYCFVVKIKIT